MNTIERFFFEKKNQKTFATESGFALLIVLWTMVLLALLATQVTGAGRAETQVAQALRSGAQLREAADGAVQETIWHMLDGDGDYWAPGAATRVLDEPGGRVEVTIIDERGKFDINQTPPALLAAFFETLGDDNTSAKQLGDAINDWRTQMPPGNSDQSEAASAYRMQGRMWGPAGNEFQRLDELLLVNGMTPALYKASLPYLTVALEQGPWLQFAPPMVLAALAKAKRENGLTIANADTRGPVVLRIIAHAKGLQGAAFTRRVLMRLDGTLSGPAWKYRILDWSMGPGDALEDAGAKS
jgi:general secretion pathway protein K